MSRALLHSVLLTSCLATGLRAQALQPAHERALVDTLRRFAHEMLAAVRRRDADAVVRFYDHSTEYTHFESGEIDTWRTLEPKMRGFMGSARSIELSWESDPTITILGRDAALIRGIDVFSGTGPDGRPFPSHRGTWTGVLRRRGSSWVVAHSHSSHAEPPPADTARRLLDSLRVRQLTGPIHVVSMFSRRERMNIVASVGPDGLLLVDHPGLLAGDDLTIALRALSAQPVRHLINTHWHPDHTGGNASVGRSTIITAHANTLRRLSERQTPSWAAEGVSPLPDTARPTQTFVDSLGIPFNGERVLVLHPGRAHTDGDAIVLFEASRVAVMGDLFHGTVMPAGDDWYSGSPAGMIQALDQILRRLPRDATLVTGHGGIHTARDLEQYRRLYAGIVTFARESIDAPSTEAPAIPPDLARAASDWGMPLSQLQEFLGYVRAGLRRERGVSGDSTLTPAAAAMPGDD